MAAVDETQPDAGPANTARERLLAASGEQLARHEAIARAATTELSGHAMRRAHRDASAALRTVIERGHSDGTISPDLPADWLIPALLALVHATAAQVHAKKLTRGEGSALLRDAVAKLVA
jgi:hypothetical protein